MKHDIFKGHLFLLTVILLSLGSGILDGIIPAFWADLVHQILFLGIPVVFYVLRSKKSAGRTLRLNPVTPFDIIILILVSLFMQPAVYLLASFAQIIFGNQLEFLFSDLTAQPFWYLMLSIAIAPAIFEELVLRGVVLDAYRGQNLYIAVVMNGFLFGLFHMNINQFVYTFFIGVILALSVYYTNSIFAGMLIHFMNNMLSVIALKYPNSWYAKLEMWLYAIESPLDLIRFVVLGIISFVIAFRLVNLLGRKNRKRYLHDASQVSFERIVNWPLVAMCAIFLVISTVLTMTLGSV
jgi:hypothetical protein